VGEDCDRLREFAPDPARQQKALEYHKLQRRGLFLELGIGFILLLAFILTPASKTLSGLLAFPSPWSAATYLLILAGSYGVITAPLSYYYDFILPHRYSLSKQGLKSWLKDKFKASGLELMLGLCLGYNPVLAYR